MPACLRGGFHPGDDRCVQFGPWGHGGARATGPGRTAHEAGERVERAVSRPNGRRHDRSRTRRFPRQPDRSHPHRRLLRRRPDGFARADSCEALGIGLTGR
ncbi:hypothetical protein GCM10018980_55830 [Streptomyces capoamus]|uniref:Uncharacterized protein n=1 Tax=Streptomyces capoamus TaxID=68183 RepID=A0A919EZN6_9ACTN|nr:hypothetical protein GCM10010501_70460 [Streptomyces libani subsp. rufus]GHG64510.1 hypothetical protein GCM10018980_55830 [Streptomyces capoamus]